MKTYTVYYYDCGVSEQRDFNSYLETLDFVVNLEDFRGKVVTHEWECVDSFESTIGDIQDNLKETNDFYKGSVK